MCTTDVSAAYGSVIAGASGFAQLVGVACGGTCFEEASRWSAVAISHGDAAVEDAAACRALCASTQLCEVWTHDDGECRLMRAMDASTITALGGLMFGYDIGVIADAKLEGDRLALRRRRRFGA